jgi:hypothetical protein
VRQLGGDAMWRSGCGPVVWFFTHRAWLVAMVYYFSVVSFKKSQPDVAKFVANL